MVSVVQAHRRYVVELMAALGLYVVALFGRVSLLDRGIADPLVRDLVTLSPILPILLAAFVVYRFYRSMDEYYRQRLLKALAVTGAATAIVAMSWSFLEDIGVPPLSKYGMLTIATTVYLAATFLYRLDDAVAEHAIGRGSKVVGWIALLVAIAAGAWLTLAYISGGAMTVALAILAGALCVLGFVSLSAGGLNRFP